MSKNKITVYDDVFKAKLDKLVRKITKLRKCCPKEAKQLIERSIKEAKDMVKALKSK